MPIETDSNRWQTSAETTSIRDDIYAFLRASPTEAYTAAEIAAAVRSTDRGSPADGDGVGLPRLLARAVGPPLLELYVRVHLSALVYYMDVEARRVRTDDGTATYYSVAT